MIESCKADEPLVGRVLSQERSVSVKEPRKTRVQLFNEVFRSVWGDKPQRQVKMPYRLLPPPAPRRAMEDSSRVVAGGLPYWDQV